MNEEEHIKDKELTEKSLLLPSPRPHSKDRLHGSPPQSRRASVASLSHRDHMTTAESWAKRDKDVPWIWYNDLYFVGPLVLFLSLLAGILFYKFYNGWTIGSATFCATATLIGSIYGVPDQPDDVGAAFTIAYYVFGISMFTAIIGAIIGSMITRAPLISAEARRKIAKMEQPEDTDGDGEIGYYDHFFFLQSQFLHFIGWEEYAFNYIVTAGAFAWACLGVLYAMFYEGWEFNHSVYFAMNAISMAALSNPPCEDGESDHCDVGTFRGLVLSVYLLCGVPLFTLAMAQLASLAINRVVRENEYKIINQPLTQDEYNYAANLYGNDEVLSLGEFTVLELLRLQRVSMEDLDQIKNLFCAIDEAETGIVDKPMLARRNLIRSPGSFGMSGSSAASLEGSGAGAGIGGPGGAGGGGGGGGCGVAGGGGGAGSSVTAVDGTDFEEHPRGRGRARTRSRSCSSAGMGGGPPMVSSQSRSHPEERSWRRDRSESRSRTYGATAGGDELESVNSGGRHSRTSSVPEVPASIKRMTFGEYNELVVPLAFTTLIENYEEEFDETREEEEEEENEDAEFNNRSTFYGDTAEDTDEENGRSNSGMRGYRSNVNTPMGNEFSAMYGSNSSSSRIGSGGSSVRGLDHHQQSHDIEPILEEECEHERECSPEKGLGVGVGVGSPDHRGDDSEEIEARRVRSLGGSGSKNSSPSNERRKARKRRSGTRSSRSSDVGATEEGYASGNRTDAQAHADVENGL
jgi:hypothetical protein